MGVAFANNWEAVLNKLQSLIRTEFKGALKVYSNVRNDMEGNQYLRISPISSNLIDYSSHLETRELGFNLILYFKEPNMKQAGTDNVMRLVSRIEALLANNLTLTLADSSLAYNCRIESTEIETTENEYLVAFDYRCVHANDVSTPSVKITAAEVSDGDTSYDATLSLTFTTSHSTTNFVVGDISVTNGSLGTLSGSGKTFTATLTPAAVGEATVQVAADKFTDYHGNKNSASDVFNWTYQKAFISTWTTTGSNETITFPLVQNNNAGSANTINMAVDWGDGSTSDVTAYDDSDRIHTYATAGTYTVTITGTVQGFQFANAGDKSKITSITTWGTFNVTNYRAFFGCSNLNITADDSPTVSSTSLWQMFESCDALTAIGGDNSTSGGGWDVSNVVTFEFMFSNADLFNEDIGGWDVSSGESFYAIFDRAAAFNQDLSSWDVSSAENMRSMFGNGVFNQDISDWDVNQVTNFTNFLENNTAFSTANYNKLLHFWEADDPINSLSFHGGDATTDTSSGGVNGTAARARLVLATGSGGDGWTITDGD